MNVELPMRCPRCKGTGTTRRWRRTATCALCQGTTQIVMRDGNMVAAPARADTLAPS